MIRHLRWPVCGLAVLLAAWAFWWEPNRLLVREVQVTPGGWPAALDGLKVVQLTDLHVGAPWVGLGKLREVVAASNAQQPDLILLTGDYVQHVLGGEAITPEAIAAELAALQAPLGVYAVLGNHDWWLDGARVARAFSAAGVAVLEDQAAALTHRGRRFWLLGIGDYNQTRHDWKTPLARLPPGEPVVAFTHSPDVFADLPAAITLTLAGHTHGGQVRLPLLGVLRIPSRYGLRYTIGVIREDGKTLFVSPGIGTSGLPVRFGVPPEISVLRLHAEAAPPSQSATTLPSAAP
ncbi:MAG: metallophosphoesterase [Pseudomonadota bacterium]